MDDDHIPQPRPPLSSEAAALIRDFLYDLIAHFESAYFVELNQYDRQKQAARHAQERSSTEPWRKRRSNESL